MDVVVLFTASIIDKSLDFEERCTLSRLIVECSKTVSRVQTDKKNAFKAGRELMMSRS